MSDLKEAIEKWADKKCPNLTDRWAMTEMLDLLWPCVEALARANIALNVLDGKSAEFNALKSLKEKVGG